MLEARATPEGERKIITALFADIKGSMELIEELDPEDARRIVDPALKLMMDAVHRYEDYVAQSTGDGIFALFGVPIAHEDHPQRALYAALRMQEETRKYRDKLRLEGGVPIHIRVGLNTGEVVVRSIRKDGNHRQLRSFRPGGAVGEAGGYYGPLVIGPRPHSLRARSKNKAKEATEIPSRPNGSCGSGSIAA